MEMMLLLFVLVLSIFLGFELINKVPSTLHTPLMSGANAISGITLVGAILSSGGDSSSITIALGTVAVFLASLNVVGGYLVTNRMLRMFYGVEDLSATMRQDHMEKGLDALSSTWFLGDFMGDIKQHFGKTGYYMHNYLSFWRQFGIVPFIAFSVILIFGSIRILKVWLKSEKLNQVHLFLFHFTVFALSEIIVARSFVTPYIWLSIGSLSLFSNYENQVE